MSESGEWGELTKTDPISRSACVVLFYYVNGRPSFTHTLLSHWEKNEHQLQSKQAPICLSVPFDRNSSLKFVSWPHFLIFCFRLQKTLPAGRSFVAMDTKQIPQILQQIFTSTMLSSAWRQIKPREQGHILSSSLIHSKPQKLVCKLWKGAWLWHRGMTCSLCVVMFGQSCFLVWHGAFVQTIRMALLLFYRSLHSVTEFSNVYLHFPDPQELVTVQRCHESCDLVLYDSSSERKNITQYLKLQ